MTGVIRQAPPGSANPTVGALSWPAFVDQRADEVLTAIATASPERTAVVQDERRLSFAELDNQVSRFAAVVAGLTTDTRAVVAVSSVLSVDFMVGYYGTLRAGRRVAVLNPLLGETALLHNLTVARPQLAYLDGATAERLEKIEHRLPAPVIHLLQEEGLPVTAEASPPAGSAADEVACLLFTSGTTGAPKTVQLTHRNLGVNAAQIALAHQLDRDSIALNHLPSFHPMHLSSALAGGSTQVLCSASEPAAALELAAECSATHYYTIPMRLMLLRRAIPHLTAVPSLRVIASGGSALPAPVACALSDRLGVPVIQGYGMAEASPLVFSDTPSDSVAGSVGRPVRGTEARVVDLETRKPLAPGQLGEIQVRGPQVMAGYLGVEQSPIDQEGWLSTGDIGRLDPTDRLVLTDRLRDTFKCDNWLVSPSELEAALRQLPGIAECVVVGLPDELHGEVAGAVLVLSGEPSRDSTDPERLREMMSPYTRAHPHYQQIRRVLITDAIARTANGKIDRGKFAAQLRGRPENLIELALEST